MYNLAVKIKSVLIVTQKPPKVREHLELET